MIQWHGEVDHSLLKRQRLQEYRAGKVSRRQICEATAQLVAAARFHGDVAPERCPICKGENLRVVKWIFGDNLGRRSGTACGDIELSGIVKEYGSCTVKEVEVCPDCKWSFLIRSLQVDRAQSESSES